KYGFNSFNWCVIDSAINKDELDDKEIFWIHFYRTHLNNNGFNKGYNMSIGGSGNKGIVMSEKTRKRMSESRMGKTHAEEVKAKIRASNKGKHAGEKNPMFGKKFSKEHREKIS